MTVLWFQVAAQSRSRQDRETHKIEKAVRPLIEITYTFTFTEEEGAHFPMVTFPAPAAGNTGCQFCPGFGAAAFVGIC